MALAVEAIRRKSKRIPFVIVQDCAQETVIHCALVLMDEGWMDTVTNKALELFKEQSRDYKRDEKMKDILQHNWCRQRGHERSKSVIRDLAENGLTPREWQVIHRMYWLGKNGQELGDELGVTRQAVSLVKISALDHMRQALHRMGIRKSNYLEWYYEGGL